MKGRGFRGARAVALAATILAVLVAQVALAGDHSRGTSTLSRSELNRLIDRRIADRVATSAKKKRKSKRGPQGPQGPQGPAGAQGPAGSEASARAFALASCSATSCTILRSKGITSITRATTGTYCVAATGIDASAAGSVAVVSEAGGDDAASAHWRSAPTHCPSDQFEVVTDVAGSVLALVNGGGTATVATPAQPLDGRRFSIAIP